MAPTSWRAIALPLRPCSCGLVRPNRGSPAKRRVTVAVSCGCGQWRRRHPPRPGRRPCGGPRRPRGRRRPARRGRRSSAAEPHRPGRRPRRRTRAARGGRAAGPPRSRSASARGGARASAAVIERMFVQFGATMKAFRSVLQGGRGSLRLGRSCGVDACRCVAASRPRPARRCEPQRSAPPRPARIRGLVFGAARRDRTASASAHPGPLCAQPAIAHRQRWIVRRWASRRGRVARACSAWWRVSYPTHWTAWRSASC
jgi:hypothetical protein